MGCGFTTRDDLACWFGNIAAFIYFLCNFPQIYLNFKKRSTKGFSNMFVVMKIFSLSFLVANSSVEDLPFPIQLSGFLLLLTTVISAIQISVYNQYFKFLLWLILPFLIMLVSYLWPSTIEYTKWINPIISLVSYIPLLYTCIAARTTYGISVFAQHLNFLGSFFGLLMCKISVFCGFVNWVFYFIGVVQATLVYAVAIYFGEMRFFDSQSSSVEENNILNNVEPDRLIKLDDVSQDILDINVDENENENDKKNKDEKEDV